MTTPLIFLDTETTSLDVEKGDVIEAAWATEGGYVQTIEFPHTLVGATREALHVNHYYQRGMIDNANVTGHQPAVAGYGGSLRDLLRDLNDATIVAENYGFDCAVLLRRLGFEPWHYRKIELSSVAMTVWDLDRPESMHKTAGRLMDHGFQIPVPDHTAAGDVECLRACYKALRRLRASQTAPVRHD